MGETGKESPNAASMGRRKYMEMIERNEKRTAGKLPFEIGILDKSLITGGNSKMSDRPMICKCGEEMSVERNTIAIECRYCHSIIYKKEE